MVTVNRTVNVAKSLEEIETELQKVVELHKEKVTEFQQEIDTAKADEQKAKQTMIDTRNGDDPKKYAKAVSEQRTASDIVGFYAGKLERLKAEPLVTKDEYREYTSRIKSEMDVINKQASNRASELIEELEAIQSELTPAYNKTNELLSNLQNNIYKHNAEKQMKEARETKTALNTSELNNEYKDRTVISGIDYILSSHAAKNIKEGGNK